MASARPLLENAALSSLLVVVLVLGLCQTTWTEGPRIPLPPDHEIVKVDEVDFGSVRRLVYRIRLPEHYPRAKVESVAHYITENLIRRGESVNAVGMFFYGPASATDGAYDVASVDWAPGGEWASADSVPAGDYSTFRYSVSYNEPRQQPASLLTTDGNATGLLGVPLPAGVRLKKRVAANPSGGVDAREEYEISASAAQILTFYEEEMRRAGWKKTGPVEKFIIFFEKDRLGLVVLVSQQGGSFTLMGGL
jgi:hypothetical protein